jgi:hypothetical protein
MIHVAMEILNEHRGLPYTTGQLAKEVATRTARKATNVASSLSSQLYKKVCEGKLLRRLRVGPQKGAGYVWPTTLAPVSAVREAVLEVLHRTAVPQWFEHVDATVARKLYGTDSYDQVAARAVLLLWREGVIRLQFNHRVMVDGNVAEYDDIPLSRRRVYAPYMGASRIQLAPEQWLRLTQEQVRKAAIDV